MLCDRLSRYSLVPRRGSLGRLLLLTAALNLAAPAAWAQSDEQRAAARSLATEGATAFNEGRYKESVDYFTRAESLVHAPPHLLFAARGLEKLGLLVKAREHYLKVVRETLPATAPQAFRDAQAAAAQELAAIEPRIGSLTLNVTGADQAKDLEVQLDGAPLPAVLIGVARPIDPGEHQISVRASGYKPHSETFRVEKGEKKARTVALVVDPNAPRAAAPVGPPASGKETWGREELPAPGVKPGALGSTLGPTDSGPSSSAAQSGSQAMKIGAYVSLGVGALGLGLGTLFLLDSRSKRSDADAAFAECNSSGDCRENDAGALRTADLDDKARSAQTLSTAGFVVGALGVGAGATLFVFAHRSAPQSGVVLRPYVGLGRAGLSGAF